RSTFNGQLSLSTAVKMHRTRRCNGSDTNATIRGVDHHVVVRHKSARTIAGLQSAVISDGRTAAPTSRNSFTVCAGAVADRAHAHCAVHVELRVCSQSADSYFSAEIVFLSAGLINTVVICCRARRQGEIEPVTVSDASGGYAVGDIQA